MKPKLPTDAAEFLSEMGMTTPNLAQSAILEGRIHLPAAKRGIGDETFSAICRWANIPDFLAPDANGSQSEASVAPPSAA